MSDPFPPSSSRHALCPPNFLEGTPLEVLALITSYLNGLDTLLLYQVSNKLLRSKLALQGGITHFSLGKATDDRAMSCKTHRNTILNIQTFYRLPSAIFMLQRLHTFKFCFPDTVKDLDADVYLLLKRLPATLKSLYLKASDVSQFVVIRSSSPSPEINTMPTTNHLEFHPLASMFPSLERLTLSDHRYYTQSFPITGFLKLLPPMLTHLKVSFIHRIKTKHLEWMPKFISSIAFRPPSNVVRAEAAFPIVREALESFGPKLSALKCFAGLDVAILQLQLSFLQELSCRELSVAQLEALPRALKRLSCSRDSSSKDEILWQQALPREALEYFRDVGFFRKMPQSFIPASLTHLEYRSSTPALIPLLSDLPCASRLTILTMNASYPQFDAFNDGLMSIPKLPKLTRLSCNFGFSYIESDHLERLPNIQELHLPASDFVDTALLTLPRDLHFLHIRTVFVTGALLDPSVTHLDAKALSSWKQFILAKYPQLTMRILTSAWSRDLSPCSPSILTHDEVVLTRLAKSFQNLPKSLTHLNLERLVNLHIRDLPRSVTRIKISVVIFLDSYLAELSTLHAITFDSCTFSIPSQLVTSYWSTIQASLHLLANTATASTPKSESDPAISCTVEQGDLPIVSLAEESREEHGISVPSDFVNPLIQTLLPQHRFDSCKFHMALSTSIFELLLETSRLLPSSVTCIDLDHAHEPIGSSSFLIPPPPSNSTSLSPSPSPLSSPSPSPVGVLPSSSDPQVRFPKLKTLICTRTDQPVSIMNLSMVRSVLPYFPNLTRLEISGHRDAPRSLQLPSGLLTLRIVKCRSILDYTLPASLVTLIIEDPMQFAEHACQHVGSLPHLKTLFVTPPGRPEHLKKLLPPSLTHVEM